MKISRISTVFFAAALIFDCCFFSFSTFAQRPVETQATPLLYPKRSVRRDANVNPASVSFQIIGLDTSRLDVSDGVEHTASLLVKNTSGSPISVYFSRKQRLATGWATSVCWDGYCYPDNVDSAVTSAPVPPGATASLELNITPALSDYSDSTTVWLRVGVVGSVADSIQLLFNGGFSPGNPPLIFRWALGSKFQFVFSGTGSHTISNVLENHSGVPTNYRFSLQDSLPQGWLLSKYCVGSNCTSGANDSSNFELYSATSNYAQKVTLNLKVPVLTRKDSAIFYLSIYPQTENRADSANYRFVGVVNTHLVNVLSNSPITGAGTITTQFKNLMTVADPYHFSLRTSLPAGWTLQNYCVGDSCSTISDMTVPFDSTGGTSAIQNITFSLQTPSLTSTDSGFLYLTSYPLDNLGDVRIDTFRVIANPQSGVSANNEETAGLAVTNAWPNPVYGIGKLTLDILTDRAGTCLARIYDINGIEQASVDLGNLQVGANQVQIANPNMRSGEYIIRIEQGAEASEIVRINYIK